MSIYIKQKLNIIRAIDISDESTEGGVITCFLKDNKLRKVSIEQCWESGKYFLNILLNSNESINKVEEIEIHYNRPFYWTKESADEYNDEWFDKEKSRKVKRAYFFQKGSIRDFSATDRDKIAPTFITDVENSIKERMLFIRSELSKKQPIV